MVKILMKMLIVSMYISIDLQKTQLFLSTLFWSYFMVSEIFKFLFLNFDAVLPILFGIFLTVIDKLRESKFS